MLSSPACLCVEYFMIVEWMTIIAIFFSLPSIMLSWSPYILWAREGCWQEDWALIEQSHWDRKAGAKKKKKFILSSTLIGALIEESPYSLLIFF